MRVHELCYCAYYLAPENREIIETDFNNADNH